MSAASRHGRLFIWYRLSYNPNMDWGIIGHQWAVGMLSRSLVRGKLRHAYLLTGRDGLGKRTLALRLAQALCCQRPPAPGAFCGRCRECQLILSQSHPDLHLIGSEKGGGSISVDQIRKLQSRLALSPFQGQWRIALLLRFSEASASAANALLKTLEEPPSRVVLLLTARAEADLLPTVVSRCEHIHLRPLAFDRLQKALMDRGVGQARARLAASVAGGRPGEAIRLAGDPTLLKRRSRRLDELMTLLSLNKGQRFEYVDSFLKEAKDPGDLSRARFESISLLAAWISLWRDSLLTAYGVQTALINSDREQDLIRLSGSLQPRELFAALHAIDRSINALEEHANTRLALETLMLDFPEL